MFGPHRESDPMSRFNQTRVAKMIDLTKMKTSKIAPSDRKAPGRISGPEKRDTPMSSIFADLNAPPKAETPKIQERRNTRRAKVKMPVRLRPADGKDQKFEEVLATMNASRANLYVVSNSSKNYYKQMRLRVTFPFDPAHDNSLKMEDTAEVMRLDHLPDGRVGVAILIRRPAQPVQQNNASSTRSSGQPSVERRFAIRHAVSATAKVVEANSGANLQARCSDLSVAGCYIDTLNPFPAGSTVHLHLSNEQRTVETDAQVITHHMGMGMGLVFDGLEPEQTLGLVDWLSNKNATPLIVVGHPAISDPSDSSKDSSSSDRALIIKLLKLLETSGKLTPSEISTLLSERVTV
jgi:hypothetical protein